MKVKSVKLDDYLQKIDFINIDIAGGEGLAIEGMTEILKKNPQVKIVMDFCPERIEKTGIEPIKCLESLSILGFKIWKIGGEEIKDIKDIKTLVEDKESKILFCKR